MCEKIKQKLNYTMSENMMNFEDLDWLVSARWETSAFLLLKNEVIERRVVVAKVGVHS